MPTVEEYIGRVRKLRWPELRKLWESIKNGSTPGWETGKAFEYMILRAFELDGGQVRWPYSVRLFGEMVEQIDGSVLIKGLYCLLESKDETENIATGPIAKIRNQLMRRPWGTVGMVFASRGFTAPAVQLAYFTLPQTILLWSGEEIEYCMTRKKIGEFCEQKYRACVDFGMPDFDIRTSDIP